MSNGILEELAFVRQKSGGTATPTLQKSRTWSRQSALLLLHFQSSHQLPPAGLLEDKVTERDLTG